MDLEAELYELESCCCTSQHLTDRELRIIELLPFGRTTEEVADELMVAPSTVANQVARMFEKLGCRNRVQLVSICYAAGILRSRYWPPQLTGRRCVPASYNFPSRAPKE